MAYSEYQKERLESILKSRVGNYEGKKFMGGYWFFVDGKMCIGTKVDKTTGRDRLGARIGDEAIPEALKRPGCRLMDITGKPLKGFVLVDAEGFDMEADLEYWVQLCVQHNPFAQRSKKKA